MEPQGPLVFTERTLTEARTNPRAKEFLVYQMAHDDSAGARVARAQIEGAAAIVPEQQRDRIFGHLFSANRDQAHGAISTLLLAKMLTDLKWTVEFEPVVDDGTPDLRVQKNTADFLDCFDGFETAEEVMYGRTVISVPIDMATGGPAGEPHLTRNAEAIARGRDRDAERARERLDAMLPFEARYGVSGYTISARVLANPYRPNPSLCEFEPIPVLTVTARDERSFTMEYVSGGATISKDECRRWFHTP